MKTARILIIVAVFLVICAAAGQAESVTEEQQAKLAEIERYIEAQKQSIEKWYAARLAIVNEQMRSGLLPLEIGDNPKFAKAGFFGWSEYNKEVLRLGGFDLSQDRDYVRILRRFRSNLLPQEQLNETAKLLAISERRLADERLRTRLQLALERTEIEKHRKYAIEVRLRDLEAKLKDNVMNPP